MSKNIRFVGLDVHAETISAAVAEGRNQVRSLGTIANRPEAVRRVLGKLGKLSELKVCREAGPTGYALYWELRFSARTFREARPARSQGLRTEDCRSGG
jgi:transposase